MLKTPIILSFFSALACVGQARTGLLSSKQPQGLVATNVKTADLSAPSASVVPNPDRFDVGRLTTFNEMHDTQIKDLMGRMTSVETNINYGRGAVGGLTVLLLGIGIFLRSFWKPILRMLITETNASPSNEGKS